MDEKVFYNISLFKKDELESSLKITADGRAGPVFGSANTSLIYCLRGFNHDNWQCLSVYYECKTKHSVKTLFIGGKAVHGA